MFDHETLHGELFVDAEMATLFGDQALLQGMLDFEAALARAGAGAGVVPAEAAEAIVSACRVERYDIAAIGRAATLAGNLAIPLVKALIAEVAALDAAAARWVHHGATSQDVIDSAHSRQFAAAVELVAARSARMAGALATLAAAHRDTPMIGRTFLQHAVPISFGLKVAGWLDGVLDCHGHLTALKAGEPQLGGAAGSLAALGEGAEAVRQAFAVLHGGSQPSLPWHSLRGRRARLTAELGILAGHLGKIGQDVALMAQTEIAELAEPEAPGKGGSSAMPHKRNPVLCTLIVAAARRVPGLVSAMLAAMPQEHERGLGGWHAEWRTLPEIFTAVGGALNHAVALIEGLQVFPERMRGNIELTRGLVMAERVSVALAEHIGRGEAYRLLEEASARAVATNGHLRDILVADPRVTAHLDAGRIASLFDPATYRGATDAMIDQVLERSAKAFGP